ncbi:MAG: STAS domain-containing protein [Rhodospirillales bacterium]
MLKILSSGPGRTHITVTGDFDAALAAAHRDALESLAKTAEGAVTVDLADTPFIDSSGVGAVVYLYKRLKTRGVSLDVTGAAGQPLQTMRTLRIERAIPVNAGAQA